MSPKELKAYQAILKMRGGPNTILVGDRKITDLHLKIVNDLLGGKKAAAKKRTPKEAAEWADKVAKELAKLLPKGNARIKPNLTGVVAFGDPKMYVGLVSAVGGKDHDFVWFKPLVYFNESDYKDGHGFNVQGRDYGWRFEDQKEADPKKVARELAAKLKTKVKKMGAEETLEALRHLVAGGVSVARLRSGQRQTFSSGNVHVHVWFDESTTKNDFGGNAPAWEWQVIVSTSPDPLNMKPRGRELAREDFRTVDKKSVGMMIGQVNKYITHALFKHGKRAAKGPKKQITDWMHVISKDSGGAFLVTLGDPKKSSSKIKGRFSDKQTAKAELKDWVKDNVGRKISPNHVIDISGQKLVPAEWEQKFVDALPDKQKKSLKLAIDLERMRRLAVFPPKDLPKKVTKGEFKKVEQWVKKTPRYKDDLFSILQGTDWEKKLRGILQGYAEAAYGQGMSHAADWVKRFSHADLHKLAKGYLESTGKSFSFSKAAGEEVEGKFEEGKPADPTENMSEEDAKKWRLENLKNKDKFKTAGFSFETARGTYSFVGNKTPFNRDTWNDIGRLEIKFKDDEGKPHTDIAITYAGSESSPALTYANEKAGDVRETIIKVTFPKGAEKEVTKALQKYGKGKGWKVTKLTSYRKPKTVKKGADQVTTLADWDKALTKQAASGLYGFTKKTQTDCEASIRKLTKQANTIARRIYAKDEKVAPFLVAHSNRAKSLSASILMSALEELGPKLASDKTAARAYGASPSGLDVDQERLWDVLWGMALDDGTAYRKMDAKGAVEKAFKMHRRDTDRALAADFKRLSKDLATEVRRYWAHTKKTARLKELQEQRTVEAKRKYGLYGYAARTANLGLQACSELREASGHIVADLHCRRGDCHDKITGFLTAHAKETKCPLCKMLNASYPDSEMRLASAQPDDWSLTWD